MLTYTPAQVEATAAFAHAALGLADAGARAPGLFAFPARRSCPRNTRLYNESAAFAHSYGLDSSLCVAESLFAKF